MHPARPRPSQHALCKVGEKRERLLGIYWAAHFLPELRMEFVADKAVVVSPEEAIRSCFAGHGHPFLTHHMLKPAESASAAPGGILLLLRAMTNLVALLANTTNLANGTNQLTLGAKVESADATRLPIRLAIALQDRGGRILLDPG